MMVDLSFPGAIVGLVILAVIVGAAAFLKKRRPTEPQAQAAPPAAPPEEPKAVYTLATVDCGSSGEGFDFELVGESFHQEEIRQALVAAGYPAGAPAYGVELDVLIVREPTNVHDPNAIAVTDHKANTLGYFSRKDALAYMRVFDFLSGENTFGACTARVFGGEAAKPQYGLWLNLPRPATLMRRVKTEVAGEDDEDDTE